MPGYRVKYPLEALLELRRRERQARELELQRGAQALERQAAQVRAVEARLHGLGSAAGGLPERESPAEAWHSYGRIVTEIHAALGEVQAAHAEMSRVLEGLRQAYLRASTREEALKRHRERFVREALSELARREEREADDRASQRHARALR